MRQAGQPASRWSLLFPGPRYSSRGIRLGYVRLDEHTPDPALDAAS